MNRDLAVVIAVGLSMACTVVGARLRTRYRQPMLQMPLYALAIVAVLVAIALSGTLPLILFAAFPGFMLAQASGQLAMLHRMRRARLAAGPLPPRTERVADPNTPPPVLRLELIEFADRLDEARREVVGGLDHFPRRRAPLPAPPTAILYLWAFEADPCSDLLTMLRSRFGPVYMLNGGGWLIGDLGQLASVLSRAHEDHLEVSETEVLRRLASFRDRKVLHWWPLHSMLCSDHVWQFALDRFLERCPLVVMDLSAYEPGRAGCEYELGQLVDRVPMSRCLFLLEPRTDLVAIEGAIRSVWASMASSSPNRSASAGPLHLVRAAHLRDMSTRSSRRCRSAGQSPRAPPLRRAGGERSGPSATPSGVAVISRDRCPG